ncbi:MAG: conjugal transfer protein TraO [Prevotellaceae bacterium]|nr:conjugal transfer protein TraO [Prevotellaceae bacterium]
MGAEYLHRHHPCCESRIPTEQFMGEGGFCCNLLSDGSKTFFLWAAFIAKSGMCLPPIMERPQRNGEKEPVFKDI